MRNTGLLAMVLFIVFVLSSCATGFIPSEEETGAYVQFSGTTETDDYTVTVVGNYEHGMLANHLTLIVRNNGTIPVLVDLNKSAYVGIQSSQRMIDGETRVLYSNLSQPLFTVAPNSSLTRDLYDPNQIGFAGNSSGNESINPRVSVCLTIEGKDQYLDLVLKAPERKTGEVIGSVEFSTIKIYPLFIGSTTSAIIRAAKKEAVKKYGEGVHVENIQYEVNWNPLSLLLYFDAFGFVKNISGTADVVRY